MNANPEFASFARLVESLRPWLDQVVVVGGWAHRLYRLHPLAQQPRYEPLQWRSPITLATSFGALYSLLRVNPKSERLSSINSRQYSCVRASPVGKDSPPKTLSRNEIHFGF